MHRGGCSWKIRRRFSEMATAHRGWQERYAGLPEFPDAGLPGLRFILGQELAVRRSLSLQEYFHAVCGKEKLVRSKEFQRFLGAARPAPVLAVQPLACSSESGRPGKTLQLEAQLPEQGEGIWTPIDVLVVTATAGGALVEGKFPAGEQIRLDGLPPGEDAVLEVWAANGIDESDALVVCCRVEGKRVGALAPGIRIRAVWAGDGKWYDGVVSSLPDSESIVVDWLRPAPLSGEKLACVSETGGDDTAHRQVPRSMVSLVQEDDEEVTEETPGCKSAPHAIEEASTACPDERSGEEAPADAVGDAVERPFSPSTSSVGDLDELAARGCPLDRKAKPATDNADAAATAAKADGEASIDIDSGRGVKSRLVSGSSSQGDVCSEKSLASGAQRVLPDCPDDPQPLRCEARKVAQHTSSGGYVTAVEKEVLTTEEAKEVVGEATLQASLSPDA
eukprot:TRINITY_DN111465_c0_g1_i1.p1 TRINITY_DN111465_c0_g1~~TRINITY_DN111465_c0_g1_i1.p1  ORF type:complete len:526 (-),score=85.56 TRINITY_DN111465_c0_g1_i1:45-1391(-)